jgi:hypothetical protein
MGNTSQVPADAIDRAAIFARVRAHPEIARHLARRPKTIGRWVVSTLVAVLLVFLVAVLSAILLSKTCFLFPPVFLAGFVYDLFALIVLAYLARQTWRWHRAKLRVEPAIVLSKRSVEREAGDAGIEPDRYVEIENEHGRRTELRAGQFAFESAEIRAGGVAISRARELISFENLTR